MPAARSARMIDMVLLGCCVSGRCVCCCDRLARGSTLAPSPYGVGVGVGVRVRVRVRVTVGLGLGV